MAVPKVKVPGSSLNPGSGGSSMRSVTPAPAGMGASVGATMPGQNANLKELPNVQSRKEGLRPPVRQGNPMNNKDAALRRLMQKYRSR